MAKRRRYGEAWKDVQIDAEQNDAVFDRFFKKTQPERDAPSRREEPAPPLGGEGSDLRAPRGESASPAAERLPKRQQLKAAVRPINPTLPNIAAGTDTSARVELVKRQFRLSKGEAAVLKCLAEKADENGGPECHAKIPQLAEMCGMTHRGCQFALRNLETRGFILRLKDYDPADRLGIQFRINLPTT
jgi:hypothetical protein